jgi:RNA polymerase subunit RPABC4/transcription elongation factor Spt4
MGLKTVGIILLIIGLIVFFIGISMNEGYLIALGGLFFIIGIIMAAYEAINTKKCPFCSQIIKKSATVCPYCHRDLIRKPINKCPYCQEPIEPGALICPHCGKAPTKTTIKKCPFCHEAIEEGTLVCPHCGNKLVPFPKE